MLSLSFVGNKASCLGIDFSASCCGVSHIYEDLIKTGSYPR